MNLRICWARSLGNRSGGLWWLRYERGSTASPASPRGHRARRRGDRASIPLGSGPDLRSIVPGHTGISTAVERHPPRPRCRVRRRRLGRKPHHALRVRNHGKQHRSGAHRGAGPLRQPGRGKHRCDRRLPVDPGHRHRRPRQPKPLRGRDSTGERPNRRGVGHLRTG